ncbi:MFS transporter [Aspergillus mulundensis]|uniref:Major facilitator superfamily (MFS) profile domain-containing protein n=1 Tax=Aspergillus mulundensis TaxID=1810919 RepID=A0A3D8SK14_9EURO|nr:hypothetical protein DSM5745_03244 [Aspergillus mulundensis]RDW86602.1 hypothetical protein DSM5745_03244 [Aspergillus mulundensis]
MPRPVGKRKPGMTAGIADDSNPPEKYQEASPGQWLASAHQNAKDVPNWNHPRSNIWKTLAAFWSFFVMGANDAASGVPLVPYLQSHYTLSYLAVSVIFLSPLIGFTIASLLDTKIYLALGRRGVAIISPSCHLLAYIANSFHPPYPVLVLTLALAGLGNGLADSAWNAWASGMEHASQVLGCLHAAFGLGAVVAPLVLTGFGARGMPWYYFYDVMIACAAVELVSSVAAFWDSTAAPGEYRYALAESLLKTNGDGNGSRPSGLRETLFQRASARIAWTGSAFLFLYVGIELGVSGWIVSFMGDVRDAGTTVSGLAAAWFWLALSSGRIVLGFVTPLVGEKLAVAVYILLEAVFGLVIHFVADIRVAAVATAMQGFFLGPLFPAIVLATARLLPEEMHVTAIGWRRGSAVWARRCFRS